jgi:hypothetical protein
MGHQHPLSLHLQLQPAGWISGGLGEINERALVQEHQQGDNGVAQRQQAGPTQQLSHSHRCFSQRPSAAQDERAQAEFDDHLHGQTSQTGSVVQTAELVLDLGRSVPPGQGCAAAAAR